MTAEEILAMIAAIDAQILVISGTSFASYSIDGQAVSSGSGTQSLLDLRKYYQDLYNASFGPWELEDRVITG